MDCYKCPICEKTLNRCNPKGSESPNIYFVGEAMGFEENKVGLPFIGSAGSLFHNLIGMLGLNESNCRFNYCIKCFPSNNGVYRSPDNDELENCKEFLYDDIVNSNPKVIVALGNIPSRVLVGERFTKITSDRGNIYDVKIRDNIYKVITTYHPSYIYNHRRDDVELEFRTDIKLAMRICVGINDIKDHKPMLQDNLSKTVEIYNYDEFDEFCKEYIDNSEIIGYDIETNALDTHSKYHEVVGFSLASSSAIGCYVVLNSIDFMINNSDRSKIEDRLRDILINKRVIVYNCMHELPATLNWLGIEIPTIDDLLVMVKLMMGTADNYEGNGGLKKQCVMNLHMKDWSKDLDDYSTCISNYKKDKDESISKIRSILSKYYVGEDLDIIVRKVIYYIEEVIPNSETFSYAFIPSKLISRYGSIDSSVLFDLKKFYEKWMDEMNKELDIDLYRGYKYWMWHHYAGYCLERNGAYWNEEKAKRIEKWCDDGKIETLREIVRSPLMLNYIKSNANDKYQKYLYDNYCDKLIDPNKFAIKRKYSRSVGVVPLGYEGENILKSMSILPNNKGVYKLEMGNILHIGKDFIVNSYDIYNKWIKDYIEDVTNESRTYEELRAIVNPNSSNESFRNYVSDMLITPQVKLAKFYDNISKLVDEPDFDLMVFLDENKDDFDSCRLVSMIYKFKSSDVKLSDRFDWFIEFINGNRNFKSWKIKRLYRDSSNYHFENMDADTFNQIYELYLMFHIDIEDRSTWTPEFEWMFNYKMFKKFVKLSSTYINGVVGRKNVYMVDKKSLENGDILTKRENRYNGEDLPDDKAYLMQAKFKVNIADTGRWTAGMHNLPASDAIKGIFTSRFKGGCIAMPDGSQMEVRTLAAESKDESLLEAFKDGVDIHRFFASRIYNVPYEDVQKWQRGLAKNAVFGMLYGESEQAFANIYLSGDIVRAREIYDGMFTGFPRIKDYIDRKHNQYETKRKVTTMTQRFINLASSREDPKRLLRQSQNYPIQASAEDIAGVILYKLCEWLRDNKMKSKPFCFIHDSIEIDMHPDEVFMILDKLDYLFNKFPLEEFGVPVACDVPLSMSMGAEIEVVKLDHSDNYRDINIILHGFEDDITELIDNWKSTYKLVEECEYEGEPDKQVYMPISERFLPKKAPISMKQGTYRNSIERKYHIITK